MKRTIAVVSAATIALSACAKMRDALSAHADVAATAGSQDLSVTRMAELLGKSQAPLRKDVARALANIWVNYHLVGIAAAKHDSLKDTKAMDEAMWPLIANMKSKMWYDSIAKGWKKVDSTSAEAEYNRGDVMAAAHILLLTQGKSPADKAKAKKQIESLHARVNAANFAEMAKKNSQDYQSGAQGGMLPAFRHGDMVPEFENALKALKPGEISGIVESPFGYHIIRRPTFNEVKPAIMQMTGATAMQASESTYLAGLERSAKAEVKPDMAKKVRDLALDPENYLTDKTVLATWDGGKLTAGRLAGWIEGFPPQAAIGQRLSTAPDSVIPKFILNFVNNELVLAEAEKHGIKPKESDMNLLHQNFRADLVNTWGMMGMDPKTVDDSARSQKKKPEQVVAERVEKYVGDLLQQKAPYVPVSLPVAHVLREKYDNSLNDAGIDRALEQAAKIRPRFDSASKAMTPSSVPMPAPAPAAPDTGKKRK